MLDPNMANVFCFFVVFIPPPPSQHGSDWLLPVISLLLTNTVSPVRACLSTWLERFRGNQKEDERGPLSRDYLTNKDDSAGIDELYASL